MEQPKKKKRTKDHPLIDSPKIPWSKDWIISKDIIATGNLSKKSTFLQQH